MKLSLFLSLSLAVSALARSDFHAYPGTEDLTEGGRVEKLTVVSGNLQFNVRPPRGWRRQVDELGQRITFTSPSGRSALVIQITPDSSPLLPQDTLRKQALQAHPGAGFVQSAVCATGYRPGLFFDLVRVPAPRLVQRIRHAFVPLPAGRAELVLSASDDEFQKDTLIFMGMLREFRVAPLKLDRP
jgi:hypothetical protein